jgi:hypothetical protein
MQCASFGPRDLLNMPFQLLEFDDDINSRLSLLHGNVALQLHIHVTADHDSPQSRHWKIRDIYLRGG